MAATPTTVMDQQLRNQSDFSSSLPVPAQGTVQNVTVAGTMSTTDASNTANVCRLQIHFSYDGGVNWETDASYSFDWVGGLNKFGQPNYPNFDRNIRSTKSDGTIAWPTHCRALFDTKGGSLNAGVTLLFI